MKNSLLLTTALVSLLVSNANANAPIVHENKDMLKKVSIYSSDDVVFKNVTFNKLNSGTASAVSNSGKSTVIDSKFVANEAYVGGAINNNGLAKLSIENSLFDGNKATVTGGAINNSNIKVTEPAEISKIVNTKFVNNEALASSSGKRSAGGAIRNQGKIGTISGVEFNGNIAGNGAALWNGTAASIESIENTKFINNKATTSLGQGGAITNAGIIKSISNTVFEGNSADNNGGAIANVVPQGNVNTNIVFNNVTFKNNTSGKNGGAIYNDKAIEFTGNTVFEGNKANGKLNDLHNIGEVKVAGNLTLDGGISGVAGKGKITIEKDANLTVKAGTTTISNNDITNNGANLNLVFGANQLGEYSLLGEGATLNQNFALKDNGIFNVIDKGNGTYTVSKKSSAAISEAIGANNMQAEAVGALTANGNSSNEAFNTVANDIVSGLQASDKSKVNASLDAITAMSPDVAPVIISNQVETSKQIFGAILSRLSGNAVAEVKEGASSGDSWLHKGAMWVQTLFNGTKLDDTAKAKGFDADMNGVVLGFEKYTENNYKFGVAYAYNNSDIDGYLRDLDVDTHTAVLYGEYKPAEWYVNAMVSYGWSEYDENKYVGRYGVSDSYDVYTFAAQAMSGYNFNLSGYGVTPEMGLRYIRMDQDMYTDSLGTKVDRNREGMLTAVAGLNVNKVFAFKNGLRVRPEARIAMTYDVIDAETNSVVSLANGASYAVSGESLNRFGVEVGLGATTQLNDNIEVSLGYEGAFRDDYKSHSGLLNAKYKF